MNGRLHRLAGAKWYARVEPDENDVVINMRDPARGGWIGPLLTVPVGMSSEDEDGEWLLETDNLDGAILHAAMLIPDTIETLLWAQRQLDTLNAIHFDTTTQCGRFLSGLRRRVTWLLDTMMLDEPMAAGDHCFIQPPRKE